MQLSNAGSRMNLRLGCEIRVEPPGRLAPSRRVQNSTALRCSSVNNPHVQQKTTSSNQPVTTGHAKGFGDVTTEHQHVPHTHASSGAGARFLAWLTANGAPPQGVTLKSVEPPSLPLTGDDLPPASNASASSIASTSSSDGKSRHHHTAPHNRPIDMVVAARHLKAGEVALSMPQNLVISLERVFESDFVAELLTTDKLSELACLTLYLMYEKKLGEESFWMPYIKELDRQRARGTQAVESPLLWDAAELDELLQGSPLLGAVKQRLVGIRREYEELDTVWYMSQSLFSKYPFDLPTETFSFERFKQAFSAVQACIVHLQGVAPARRFALVPLGPPLLSYSSTCKALLSWNEASRSIQLVVDRDYEEGEPVAAWCGPQPNTRLLLNYGLVDEHNPYDKLQLTTILGTTDPLFQAKRAHLQAAALSTSQTWDLQRNKPLPASLLPYMRLAAATTPEEVRQVSFESGGKPSSPEVEAKIKAQLIAHLQGRMAAYRHSMAGDIAIMADPHTTPRQKVAARLTKIEKSILQSALEQLGAGTTAAADTTQITPLPYLKLT